MVSWGQQVVRGALYGTQFTAAFRKRSSLLLLPLAQCVCSAHVARHVLQRLQYAGQHFALLSLTSSSVLFAIFLGGTAGYITFGRDTVQMDVKGDSGCCWYAFRLRQPFVSDCSIVDAPWGIGAVVFYFPVYHALQLHHDTRPVSIILSYKVSTSTLFSSSLACPRLIPSPVRALSVNQSRPSILLSVTKAGQSSVKIARASLASVADREIFDDFATLTQTSSRGTARLYRDAAVADELGEGGATGANSLDKMSA